MMEWIELNPIALVFSSTVLFVLVVLLLINDWCMRKERDLYKSYCMYWRAMYYLTETEGGKDNG